MEVRGPVHSLHQAPSRSDVREERVSYPTHAAGTRAAGFTVDDALHAAPEKAFVLEVQSLGTFPEKKGERRQDGNGENWEQPCFGTRNRQVHLCGWLGRGTVWRPSAPEALGSCAVGTRPEAARNGRRCRRGE